MLRPLFLSLLLSALCASAQQGPAHYDDGNVVTTPAQVRRVPPPDPSSTAEQLEQTGDQLRGTKEFADALDYYSAAIAKAPDQGRLYNKRGMARVGMMQLAEAKKDFSRAAKLDKTLAEAENNLGAMYYYADRNYGGAVKHYQKAIAIDPRPNFYSNLGTAYFARKDYDKAEDSYRKALQLDPEVFEHQSSRTAVQLVASSVEEQARHDYVIAKMYASFGDPERCILYLKKAMENGFPVAEKIKKDKEFAGLRNDARVKELLASHPITVN